MSKAKDARRVLIGTRSRAAGSAFEDDIISSLEWFEQMGIMRVKKTPEPVRQLSAKDENGHFKACYEKKAQVDFAGTVNGGIAIRFEAKQTDTDRFLRTRLSDEQMQDLDANFRLGAICFVLLCFGAYSYYRVPWPVWRDMKQIFGRQYVTEEDLPQYRIEARNGVIQILNAKKIKKY